MFQTIDAKFLLSAGGMRNSLDKEDEKPNQNNRNEVKIPS